MSRQHARIFVREGAFWIEDMDSANGTFVRLVGALSANGSWTGT